VRGKNQINNANFTNALKTITE
jgi:hypothetical protein